VKGLAHFQWAYIHLDELRQILRQGPEAHSEKNMLQHATAGLDPDGFPGGFHRHIGASVLGIRNVLALTGDYASLGDHPQAKPVFDLDSVNLLKVIKTLEGGTDMVGNVLQGTPKFCVGAVVNPGGNPVEAQLFKMEKKIKAGAAFFQTQAVYDVGAFEKFMKRVVQFKVPVLGGIILLKSAGMARFMNKNVAGVFVPEPLIQKMAKAEDRVKTSIEIGADLIRDLKGMCQGVHIMPIGWESKVPALLDAAKL